VSKTKKLARELAHEFYARRFGNANGFPWARLIPEAQSGWLAISRHVEKMLKAKTKTKGKI